MARDPLEGTTEEERRAYALIFTALELLGYSEPMKTIMAGHIVSTGRAQRGVA